MLARTRGLVAERLVHIEKVGGSIPPGSTVNILFFSRLFYPHIGGVEKHLLEISRLLLKKGHEVSIVTEQHEKKIKLEEKFEGIKIYRIPDLSEGWVKKFRIWLWLWKHKDLVAKADIVHCHDVFFWYLPFRFLFFRKPVYTTFHGYESYPIKRKSIWVRKISEKLSKGNICIGSFMKKWYGVKPDYVSYGGVNIVNSEKLKVKSSAGAVFIGRLDEQTGIKTYVNAVKLIKKKIPNFKFEIVGDGKYRKEIEKDFKVLGFQKKPEKYFLEYNFAFVSRYLTIFEAMAAKRLVFAAYDNPLKEDYLKMSPFAELINIVGSENELAEKVLHFLNNPKEAEMLVENAFEWIKKNTWKEMYDTYLRLWNNSF